jgi:hypothetical protein
MAAVEGLAEIGDETLIGPLETLAQRFPETPFVQFAVAAAIQRSRGT